MCRRQVEQQSRALGRLGASMPSLELLIDGKPHSVQIPSADVPVGSLRALAPCGEATVFIITVPLDDATTLSAAKWDGRQPVIVGRRGIKLAEVAQHQKKGDLWLVLHAGEVFGGGQSAEPGKAPYCVYDLSDYMDDHPGGPQSLLGAGACFLVAGLLTLVLQVTSLPHNCSPPFLTAGRQGGCHSRLYIRGPLPKRQKICAEAVHWRAVRGGGGFAFRKGRQGGRVQY